MDDLVQNTAEIRSFNIKKIVEYLRFNDPITKKDLADKLNLSFATVSNICNQLVNERILQDMAFDAFNGGRIAKLISINPSSKYVLCLDLIQKEVIKVATVNLKNEVLKVDSAKIPAGAGLNEIIAMVYELSNRSINQLAISFENVLGVGVVAPGIYNKNNKNIVNSTNPIFENQPLKEMIEAAFKLPVFIENESNLLVMATASTDFRDFKNKDLIYIYIGEGLGSGIISNGKVITGSRGLGGEISHMPIGERNFECYGGHQGCVESELNLNGFLKKYYQREERLPCFNSEDWEEFVAAVLSGETTAMGVIEENGKLLGKLVSVLVNLFDPEAIYIGGIVEKIFDYLHPHIIKEAKSRIIVNHLREIPVYASVDYESLIFMGCSEIVLSEWNP